MPTEIPLSPKRWSIAWVAFLFVHAALMTVDWYLRDPANPKAGGLPGVLGESLCTGIYWSTFALLALGVFFWMPRHWAIWIRGLLALVQTGIAYAVIVIGNLYYVLHNGIDTL